MVEIKIDARQIKQLEKVVAKIKDGVPKVLAPAINRTLTSGRAAVKREIRKMYLIKAKDIPVRVNRATRQTLGGSLVIKQGMQGLAKFKVSPPGVQRRKNKRILHVTVKRGGGRDLPHAFVAPTANYVGPFERVGNSRLPIRRLVAIGASIMASQPTVAPAVQKAMTETLRKRVDHEIARLMADAGRK